MNQDESEQSGNDGTAVSARTERRKAEQALLLTQKVERAQVKVGAEIISARAYIERAVAAGFNTLYQQRSGKHRWYLRNLDTQHKRPLNVSMGMVDYVRVVLGMMPVESDIQAD